MWGQIQITPRGEFQISLQSEVSTDFSEPTCVTAGTRECQKSASGEEVILYAYEEVT